MQSTLKSNFDVAICGAGPGGAALASILAGRGISTALIERQSEFSNEFRGEGIMPSGYKALKAIGFDLDKVILPLQKNVRAKVYNQGKSLVDFEFPFSTNGGLRWVSQPALLEHIVQHSLAKGGLTFFRGSHVFDVLREKNRVSGLRVSQKGKKLDIKARVIIGFDGRGSILRRKLKFEVLDFEQMIDVIWFKVPYPHEFLDSGTALVNFVKKGFMICPACYNDELQVGWIIAKNSYGEIKKLGEDAWISEIQKQCPKELADHLERNRDNISDKFVLNVELSRCTTWSKSGVLLLGDAAHTMNPVGAQGINIALRDAVVAANHLVPVFSGEPTDRNLDVAFGEIERERLREVEIIQDFQRRPPTLLHRQNSLILFLIQNLSRLSRLKFFRKRVLELADKLAYGVTNVELKV